MLSIGVWKGEPLSLAPVVGLPWLRTLTAYPGTLADPLEVAGRAHDGRNPLQLVPVANEILAFWDHPPITETILEGDVSGAVAQSGEHRPAPNYYDLANRAPRGSR